MSLTCLNYLQSGGEIVFLIHKKKFYDEVVTFSYFQGQLLTNSLTGNLKIFTMHKML